MTDDPPPSDVDPAGSVGGADGDTGEPAPALAAAGLDASPVPDAAPDGPDSASPLEGWRGILADLRRDRSALAGLVVVAVAVGVATVAFVDAVVLDYLSGIGLLADLGVEQYWLAKTVWTSPTAETGAELLPPAGFENGFGQGTLAHPLGTDDRGRDVLLRVLYGSRIALQVGVLAAGIGVGGGSVVGAVAGYYGGWVDDVLMRGVEVLYAVPFLVLVLALLSVLQAGGNLVVVTLVVGLAYVPEFARLIRSRVLAVREAGYVEAARAAGLSNPAIVRRHVLPNSLTPVLVQGTLRVGTAILVVAGLSFLGFGVGEPTPSWGAMLATARDLLLQNLWLSIWPGLAIAVTVLGFTLLGDGLRDAMDPERSNRHD